MEQKPQWSHSVGEQTQTPESQAAPCWAFDAFLLDRRDERLWRDQEILPLSPKPFALLCHLVACRPACYQRCLAGGRVAQDDGE